MLSEPQRIAAFEAVLRDSFGLDPVACRESDDWWRFTVGKHKFQGGIHTRDVRVLALLCALDPDLDDTLYTDIDQSACPDGLASFREADCYLYAEARLPLAGVTQAQIEQAIRDCITAAESPAATKLQAKWAYYG